jgi:hypothetical protein
MVGQVIRAVEVPISLSISVARKGAELAGRVAGWAVTEIVHGLSPGRQDEAFSAAADEYPGEPASTSTWEPASVDATEEHAPVSVIEEEGETVSVIEERPEPASVTEEEPESVSVMEEEPEAVSPSEEERAAAKAATEEPEPVDRAEAEPAPIGGEDGAVVEHEPGIVTSVRARDPHSALNNPVTEADMTEWPDPYDHREDPRDPGEEMVFGGEAGHTQTGATSTSEPHPSEDPEAEPWEGPKRDKVDQ